MTNRLFYISSFDSDVALSISGEIALGDAVSDRTDVSATAYVYVDLSRLSHVFHFSSDAVDITDSDTTSDIQFDISVNAFIDLFNATDKSLLGNAQTAYDGSTIGGLAAEASSYRTDANGTLFSTGTRGVKYDVVRDLASQLFNTYHGVDLFTNETDLRNDVHDKVNNIVSSVASGIPLVVHDCSRSTYDQAAASNIGSEILRQILESKSSLSLNVDTSGTTTGKTGIDASFYYMPFVAGDALQFILNVAGAPNQKVLTGGTGTTHRRYDMRIIASTTPGTLNIDPSNSDV